MDDKDKQRMSYPLRMSAELRAELEDDAARVGRSLHTEIIRRLQGTASARAQEAVGQKESVDQIAKESMIRGLERGPQETASRDLDKFMLRLPDGMRERIAEVAKTNNRSMNAEIISCLSQFYGEDAVTGDSFQERQISLMEQMLDELKEMNSKL
jgi:predicted HicB family RNase H-like nuclease